MSTNATSFYDLSPLDSKKKPFPFADLKGKAVLIVNVASKCGFTKQYEGLEELNQKYKDKGLVIIGFPCNQFGHQEPGTNEEIGSFCTTNFGVTFPVLDKIEVNGSNEDPVYKWLKSQKSGVFGLMNRIKWNFEKFLVDKRGNVYERYNSLKEPSSIASDIEKVLEQE